MDLPLENMFDTYKDVICKELGPLDPDWFETLTSQMFTEDNASDQDDLCGNQEANFKTPFDKTAVDSQLFSTPKVFRHSRVVSPETEDERSFTEKEALPWTTPQSPYLFKMSTVGIQGAKYGGFLPQSQDRFDLHLTPQKSPVTYDKQISESLGVQLHPDISWTSSLNTPSAIPSTLILSEKNESPCEVRSPEFKNVIFVRKLFPSLSNASRVGRVSPKNNDVTAFPQGDVSPEARQNPESHDLPPGSPNQSDLDWKQTLPDAIEDGEIRKTVASVLEGAENVLSMFFTNSSSALRKVKTERIKRKPITPTIDNGSISSDVPSTSNDASCEQRTADKDPDRPPAPPLVETVDSGITQWSPLSLSDLPPCTLPTSFHDSSPAIQVGNNVSTEQLRRDSDSGRPVARTPPKHTDTAFTKKKRTFVYTVETPKLQVPGKEKPCQRMNSSPAAPDPGQEVNVKRSKAPDEALLPKQGKLGDPTPRPPVRAKVHDPDMSQLCKEFVQDVSQTSDHCQLSKVHGGTPGTGFSPSACLSALRRAKRKTMHAKPCHDLGGVGDTHHSNPINEGAIGDSGFQSAVADGARGGASSFLLPSSEIRGLQWADEHGTPTVASRNIANGEVHPEDILQPAETDDKQFVGESQSLGPGRKSELHTGSTSAPRPSTGKKAVEFNDCSSINGHLPEKTSSLLSAHPSGFQTTSNKSIRITSSNLERAKRLFEEAEGESPSGDQPIKCARDSKGEMSVRSEAVEKPTAKSYQPLSSREANKSTGCQLTASQKADVTELCILLEEADTQFEFTQFKTEKPKVNGHADAPSPLEVDNELDPDSLSGIDFDDSFSSQVEKHLAVAVVPDEMTSSSDGRTSRETSEVTGNSTGLLRSNAMKKGSDPFPEEGSTSSKHLSAGSCRVISADPKHPDGAGERSELQNGNPLMPGAGFKTAGGNALRLSKASLARARVLFADIEGHPVTSETSQDKLSSETGAKSSLHEPAGDLLHRTEGGSTSTDCGHGTEGRVRGSLSDAEDFVCSEGQVPGVGDADSAKPLANGKMDTATRGSGFQVAGGKGTSLSAEAKREAHAPRRDCDASDSNAGGKSTEGFPAHVPHEETRPRGQVQGMKVNKEPISEFESVNPGPAASHSVVVQHDEEIVNLGCAKTPALTNAPSLRGKTCHQLQVPLPISGGFQTASGKAVAISSAALKKAKSLLSECVEVEDKVFVKPTHSKVPLPGPTSGNTGFLAASGKKVAFSSEALQRAKALFSDISSTADIPAASEAKSADDETQAGNTEQARCAFTNTAHVSQRSPLEAKKVLTGFAGVECHNSNSLNPHALKSDPCKLKGVKTTCNPPPSRTLCGAPESSLQDSDLQSPPNQSVPSCIFIKAQEHSFSAREGKMTPQVLRRLHDAAVDDPLDCEVKPASSREGSEVKRPRVSSVGLSGCTETQQRLFAQEALDCTKALLEDESLFGQSLSMTLENVPLQGNTKSSFRSAEERRRPGKRSVEEPEMPGQPPLKRRLLEEFDRTAHGSILLPEKSCPNGVIKDRRIFKYNVSLHPNITRPCTNGKNYVETRLQNTTPTQRSTPGDRRSAHSKKPAFVPPFLANAKMDIGHNAALRDNARTPSAFVPPFKKQRAVVQGSSFRPPLVEEKDKKLFVTPFNSNTYIAPAKKKQCTPEIAGNNSKEDSETVALADNKNIKKMNSPNLPVGCGSEGSSAETSLGEGLLSRCQESFQNLPNVELARDMQDMRIRKKKRQTIRPLPGSLFLTKTSGVTRIPLKAAVHGRPPARYTPQQLYRHGVHRHVCEISSDTAESFRFDLRQFIKREAFLDGGGVQLADGGWLIPSKDGTAGKEEFYRALCDTPGVDPKLISDGWVDNHYRWVVWKQASMERSFPETMGSLCLTPEQVLLQLKYRYDVEVDHSRRPALRRITERDDTAAKTLVLCVCGVVSKGQSPNERSADDSKAPRGAAARVGNPSAVVWLTDGWYAVRAQLDEPLTAMLHDGRVAVGGKLIVHGAQLVGSQDACSPLEAPEALMLKICANSSRPVRWDAKLGFYKDPRPFLLPLSCLYSGGGQVGCVDVIVLRSYPIQWMERKPEGGVVFRSVRAEEKEARRFDGLKQKAMEILFAKIQDEFEKEHKGDDQPQRRRRAISHQAIAGLQSGEELCEAAGEDPVHLEAHLSEQQLETLNTYRRCAMEKKQAQLQDRFQRALASAEASDGSCPKREVTPVWRLSVADSSDQRGSVYQLNLWRPSSDLQALLKEGRRYKVYNLTTSDGKKHNGSSNVQLTGTKKTQFQDLQASREWLATHFQPRVSTCFVDLQNPEFQSLCGEVDLTGFVIQIVDGQGFSPAFYLADGELNFVKVRCFSSFAQSGLEDLVKPRVLLSLSNLQLRGQSASPTPVVYAGDLTIFSANPKEGHLQESLSQTRTLRQSQENFFLIAEETLSHLVQSDGRRPLCSPALHTRTPASTTAVIQDTTASGASPQLVRSRGSFTPIGRKPPTANCSTETDAGSVKRRKASNYLSRIPSPPPLLNLGSVASPGVNKTFNPPRRSGTPSTLKTVQNPAHKAVYSPVEDEWVKDEELAMIDTQALRVGDSLQVHKTV